MPITAAAIEQYGTLPDGRSVTRYLLGRPGGIRLAVLDHGATIQGLWVPDGSGASRNVVLGAPDLDGYVRSYGDYYGALVGRFANRIAGGRFSLDGVEHRLITNEGPHTLHGGPDGFHCRRWDVVRVDTDGIELRLVSPHGDQGFPGELTAGVTYEIADNSVSIQLTATTTRPTVVNLTQHAHFNLDGEGTGSIIEHTLQVAADRYLPIGTDLIPTGRLAPVAGSPFDFRRPRPVVDALRSGHRQVAIAGGLDHNFVLDRDSDEPAAVLLSSDRQLELDVFTDQPGLQVYSGNFFDGSHVGTTGRTYERRAGIALETQNFPDAPNHAGPDWPDATLMPGERYDATTVWRFTTASTDTE